MDENREVWGGTVNQYVLDAGIVLGQPPSNLHASSVIVAVGTGKNPNAGWRPDERAHPKIFIAGKEEGRSRHDTIAN